MWEHLSLNLAGQCPGAVGAGPGGGEQPGRGAEQEAWAVQEKPSRDVNLITEMRSCLLEREARKYKCFWRTNRIWLWFDGKMEISY